MWSVNIRQPFKQYASVAEVDEEGCLKQHFICWIQSGFRL